jgi:DNA repair exonuclease SbcCD ATPase subunit
MLNDIKIYRNLINSLEGHEYNPHCAQCMKNPKVTELIKYTRLIEEYELNKDKIEFEIEESADVEIVYAEYEKIKNDLNNNYKIYNDAIKKLAEIEQKNMYYSLIKNIADEQAKLANHPGYIRVKEFESEIKKYREKTANKEMFEKEISELIECREIVIHNSKIASQIKILKEKIFDLKNKTDKKKNEFAELSMKIMKTNVAILENKNLLVKEEHLLENLGNKLVIMTKNNEIMGQTSVLKDGLKKMDNEMSVLRSTIYKLEELIKTNDRLIKNYDDKKAQFSKIYDEKELYGTYLELVNKNGLPLHILKRYLSHISDGINAIAEEFIGKKIDLFIEDSDIVLNIIVKDDSGGNRNIMMLGGREAFVIDIAFKIVLAKIAHLPKSNFLFIDEGISVFDKEHIGSINDLFAYLSNYFDYVFLMSHIEEIKDYVSRKIYIRSGEDGCSVIKYE